MEVFDAIRTLLAVREYSDQPLPDDAIKRIMESGRLSASGMNLQPWHFVAVQDKAGLRKLGELVTTGPYIAAAQLAVVVAVEKESKLGISDGSRAIQSMMLTAWADGIGSNWTGFANLDNVGEFVGLPERYQALAVIPFGYPARQIGKGLKKRKALSEVASAERYGQTFSD